MSTMVALVGDQPLPNFIPLRHFSFDKVLLVYTKTKAEQFEKLEAVLKKEPCLVEIYTLETGAYDIPDIAAALNEELTCLHLPNSEQLVFNLTGGTKPMSLAAYQVAQLRNASMIYVQSTSRETWVYHSTWFNQELQNGGKEFIPACITLQDIFDLHLGIGNWQECGPSKDIGGHFEKVLANTFDVEKYEVMSGVKTLNKQVEVDIAVRFNNHYGIIEAKSGENGKKLDGIKQLSTALPLLGIYSRAFHVITVDPHKEHKALREALHMKTISLKSYDPTAKAISDNDKTELLARIEEAFNEET